MKLRMLFSYFASIFLIVSSIAVADEYTSDLVNENLVEKANFNAFLKRDFMQFLDREFRSYVLDVKSELLRPAPTQTGISYPKYYLWLDIRFADVKMKQAAAKVSSVDETHFEVEQCLSIEQLNRKSTELGKIFPGDVVDKIIERVKMISSSVESKMK